MAKKVNVKTSSGYRVVLRLHCLTRYLWTNTGQNLHREAVNSFNDRVLTITSLGETSPITALRKVFIHPSALRRQTCEPSNNAGTLNTFIHIHLLSELADTQVVTSEYNSTSTDTEISTSSNP